MSHQPVIVAVDGPAGSGKSSICAAAAEKLGWMTLNTGMIYRAAAYVGIQKKYVVAPHPEGGSDFEVNEPNLVRLTEELAQELQWDDRMQGLLWQGKPLGAALNDPIIAQAASLIAKMGGVRQSLLNIQRVLALGAPRGIFVDGRDIGTVVFPDAALKLFFTASLEVRAKRRLDQLADPTSSLKGGLQKEKELALEDIRNDIAFRDHQDQSRQNAPLKKALDAVEFDTSLWNFKESVEQLVKLIEERGLIKS